MCPITVRGRTVRLANGILFFAIDPDVEKGEIVTVVGPSGSGKTTLLHVLAGSVPFSGSVESEPGLRIGYAPQRLHLDSNLPPTVGRFLQLGTPGRRRNAILALEELELHDFAGYQMSTLSGGQFQRALLARVFLSGPDLFLLDEPVKSLAPSAIVPLCCLVNETRKKEKLLRFNSRPRPPRRFGATDREIGLNGII